MARQARRGLRRTRRFRLPRRRSSLQHPCPYQQLGLAFRAEDSTNPTYGGLGAVLRRKEPPPSNDGEAPRLVQTHPLYHLRSSVLRRLRASGDVPHQVSNARVAPPPPSPYVAPLPFPGTARP